MKLSPTVIIIGSYEMKLNGYHQKNVPDEERKQIEIAVSQNDKQLRQSIYSAYEKYKYDKRLISKRDTFLTSFKCIFLIDRPFCFLFRSFFCQVNYLKVYFYDMACM